ncbi:MAG: hypothetical protein SNJ78_10950 [Spirochaetales bacterium]
MAILVFNVIEGEADKQGMMLTLYKKDKRGNTYFYTLHDRQGSLFAPFTLTVTWGNSLQKSTERVYTFQTHQEMNKKIREIIDGKIQKGYSVLYSYFRPTDAKDIRLQIERANSFKFREGLS